MTTRPLMTLNQIKIGLKDIRFHSVTQATNLSYPTLQRLAKGEANNYTLETLTKISDYLWDRKEAVDID